MFEAMNTAGSGLSVYQTWLDSLANNISNVNTVRPTSEPAFQAEYLQARSMGGGDGRVGQGIEATDIKYGNPEGQLAYDPANPIADADGYVRRPDIDLGQQMSNLIIAQRAFQANAAVIDRAHDSYQAAIDIAKRA